MSSARVATVVKVATGALLLGALSLVVPGSAAAPKAAPHLPEKLQRMLSEGALPCKGQSPRFPPRPGCQQGLGEARFAP